MPIAWQVTIDCADPNRLVAFWCEALGYVPEPPPESWSSWLDYWLAAGLPEEELEGADEGSGAIIDPDGRRPADLVPAGAGAQVGEEPSAPRLQGSRPGAPCPMPRGAPAWTPRSSASWDWAPASATQRPEGADYYAVTLRDPEGNEFCVT